MSGRDAPVRIARPLPARAMTARLSPATLPCLTTSSSRAGTITTTSNGSPASIFCLKAAASPKVRLSLCPEARSNSGASSSITSRSPFEHNTLSSAACAPPAPRARAKPASASHIAPPRIVSSRVPLLRIPGKRTMGCKTPVVAQGVLRPGLRQLRPVLVPRAWIEPAERLVLHLVHLAKQLDPHVVGVAVVGRNVVADDVARRPPHQVDVVLGEEVAGTVDLRPVLHLERDVM